MISVSKAIPSPSTPVGILGCIGGLFIHLVIGSLYQWGIVSIYITSYYHYSDQSVTLQSTAIAFPLMMFCIGLTMRLGLYLSEVIHPLAVSIGGQILCGITILISSFMSDVWLFIFFYGIMFGLFAGLNFMVPIYQCNKYLVGKKMYVNGLILIGTGCGPIVFGLFSYNFLNPDKIPPIGGYYFGTNELEMIAFKVPTLLKWLALLYFGVGMIGTLMLIPVYIHNRRVQSFRKEAKKDESSKQNLEKKEEINHSSKQEGKIIVDTNAHDGQKQGKIHFHHLQDKNNHHQVSTTLIVTNPVIPSTTQLNKKMTVGKLEPISAQKIKTQPQLPIAESIFIALKSKVFWIMMIILFICSCGSFLLNGNYKTYVKSTIRDDNYLTIIGVIGCVGNGCSRFFWSLYYSKTGFKTALLTIMLIQIIIFSTIRFTTSLPGAYTFEIFLSNCCIGGYLVATPTATQNIYGQVTGANIYGIYWCNFALANFLGYIYVSNLTKIIGFDNVIYICLGMTVIVCPFIVFTKFQGSWGNPTHQVQFCVGNQLAKIQVQKVKEQPPIKEMQKVPSISHITSQDNNKNEQHDFQSI